jgi:plastocyanin
VTVPVGSTVTWTNDDRFDHSVVADDDSFVSESLGKGDVFEHTFTAAGEYAYICGIHPYMEATVTVTA